MGKCCLVTESHKLSELEASSYRYLLITATLPSQTVKDQLQAFSQDDALDKYAFSHKSFMEFFTARRILRGLAQNDATVLELCSTDTKVSFTER
jgi:predicted NACHT family NTPase